MGDKELEMTPHGWILGLLPSQHFKRIKGEDEKVVGLQRIEMVTHGLMAWTYINQRGSYT